VAIVTSTCDCVLDQFPTTDDNGNPRIGSPAIRSTDEPHIGKYRLIKTIGKGNFAKVKLAKHVPTGRQVCEVQIQYLLLTCKIYVS